MADKRRDASDLADELDKMIPSDSTDIAGEAEVDVLVDVARRLAESQRPGPSADARARMQARMMAAVDNMPTFSPVRRLVTRATVGVMAAAAVLVVVIFGVGPAIADSVPGDLLYPAKQAIERGELAFARITGDESDILIWQAARRLKEAQALLDDGEYDLELLADVLIDVERAAAALSDDGGARAQFMLEVGQMMGPLGEAIEASVTRRLGELVDGGQIIVQGPVMTPGPTAPSAQMPVVQPSEPPASATATETMTATVTTTVTPTSTATATESVTTTATSTVTATATLTARPTSTGTITATATSTPTDVSAGETDLPRSIVIEGEVEEIDGNIVVIFGIVIRLNPDDPLLAVIQVGDVLRIEGEYDAENDVVIAVTFYFIGIDVVINDGGGEGGTGSGSGAGGIEVWRDNGSCNNPPPPWAPAVGWRNRCEGDDDSSGSGAPGNSGNPPGGPPITPPGGGRP